MADAFALANAFVRIRPTAHGFRAEADAEIQQQLAGLGPTIKINASTAEAKARAAELQAYIKQLADRTYTLRLAADDKAAQAKLTRLYGQLLKLDGRVVSTKMTLTGFTRMQAELLTIDAALDHAGLAAEGAGKKASLAGKGWDSLWRSLGKAIPLAGGVFGHIAVWHLLLDTLIEIIAVWAAAAVAVGAFAVAAMKAAREVATQVRSMGIVMAATNQIIPPMTGNFRKLQAAIQPRVYQLAGAALAVMSHQGSAFSIIAMGAAHVLDVFAARLALALTGGKGMGRFLQGAVPILSKLMEAFAAFGQIIGNIFKALPGFAEMLLGVGTALLKIGAAVTGFLEPGLKLIFWLHGAVVWGGLAITAVLGLGRAFKTLLLAKVVTSIAAYIADIITLTLVQGAGVAATELYMGALEALGMISPLGWAVIAIGAVVALSVALMHARSAADSFGDSMQAMISKAPVQNALTKVSEAITLTTRRFAVASEHLNKVQHEQGRVLGGSARAVNSYYGQVTRAALQQSAYARQNEGLNATLIRGRGHVAELSKAYGGNAAAQGLLIAAGVTTDQLLTKSNAEWAIARQMVEDTARAYRFMGATGSVLSNDMEVLNMQASTQAQAVQKLNQAWDAFIQGVSAGQQSFDTFTLGMVTLRQNMDKASQAQATITHHLGELKVKSDLTGAAMDGLSQASLSLNQAFATNVQNAGAVIDELRSASIGGHEFKRAIRDLVAQMLPFAKGSQEATSQLFALAQEAGIHGPATMSNLIRWLGKTHGATKDLKKIMNEATIQEGLLTAAMDDQAKFIKDQLLGAIDSAIVKYSGVTGAATDYGKAVAGSGKSSDVAKEKFRILTEKVFDAQVQMGKGRQAALDITSAILGIPKSRTLSILEKGVGRFTINGALPGGVPSRPGSGPGIRGGATGMLVTTGSGPTADDNLVRVSKGELIVPANMVSGGAVDHLRGSIPGFAQGGLISQGSAAVLSGRAVVNYDQQFVRQLTDSMKQAMTAAMRTAVSAARSALSSFPGGDLGAHGGNALANQNIARQLLPLYGWGQNQMPSLIALWNGESGWNQFASNGGGGPDSGRAYGIPQSLPGSKMAAAGADWRTNPLTQERWGLGYIRSVYGSPSHAYSLWLSRSPHWYAEGTGGAMPGWAMVGEEGPELVKMNGGETVIPAGLSSMAMGGLVRGYRKGTGKKGPGVSLTREIEQALGIIRAHPFAPDRQSQLTGVLDHVLGRIHGERSLLRVPGLARHQRANLLHHLHHDERRRKWLLGKLGPVRHHMGAVSRAERHLQARMNDLQHGIHSASQLGYHGLENQLRHRLSYRKYQMSELADWARYQRPRVANRQAQRHAHSIIESVLGDMGLPTAGFDKGGYLMPGATLAVNGLGRPERVGAQPVQVVMSTRGGRSDFDRFMHNWITKHVDFHGGGDVQVTFGSKHY